MTTITRWNPMREMAAMQSALDRVFDETWRNFRTFNGSADKSLALDVYETANAYIIQVALPGTTPENVNVSLHEGVLTISGQIAQSTPENSRALMLERAYGQFTRSIRLPAPINSDQTEAVFENGVLSLTLPKTPEAQPHQIPVRLGNGQHHNN
jgi:HSP20 family protein